MRGDEEPPPSIVRGRPRVAQRCDGGPGLSEPSPAAPSRSPPLPIDFRYELVAAGASEDLAYTLGYEHSSFSMDGGPVQPATLRVTHVYRRENGEWKIVHRHADPPPIEQSPPTT